MSKQNIKKENAKRQLRDEETSILHKYQDFFIGRFGFGAFLRFEVTRVFASPCPGAVGYALRKILFPGLFGTCGQGSQFGRNLSVRHPHKIKIGSHFAIDDDCLLDARGVEEGGFSIGDRVLISRGTNIAAKTDHGTVTIGNDCIIGRDCILASTGGIELGSSVAIGSQSFVGGGRYRTDSLDRPMIEQEMYTEGPVIIEDDCWIGVGAKVMDGVTIGRGSIIGAGTVVHEDVPEYTVAVSAGHRRLKTWPREVEDTNGEDASVSRTPERDGACV